MLRFADGRVSSHVAAVAAHGHHRLRSGHEGVHDDVIVPVRYSKFITRSTIDSIEEAASNQNPTEWPGRHRR